MSKNRNMSTNMLKQTFILTLVSAITLIVSFGKETIVAFFFGTTKVADAYTVAVEFPITLFSIVSVAISTVLIPMYLKILENEGKLSAERYASNLVTIVTVMGAVLLVFFELFAEPLMKIIAPGLGEETLILAKTLFRLLLPITMLTLIVNINTGISNSNKNYFFPSLTPNLLNIPIIVVAFSYAKKIGIYAVVWGTFLGIILELIYSYIIASKYYHYKPYVDIKDKNIRLTIKLAVPTLIGTGAEELNKIVDRIFSSMLPAGSIASLNYGSKLSSGIYSLIIASMSVVAYSEFASAAARKDKKGLFAAFEFSNRIAILLLTPIVTGGILLSREIITLVFARGAFTDKDAAFTAPIFAAYLVGLIFSAIRVTCCKYCYSLGDTKMPTKTTVLCVALNIPLNALLSYKYGACGLAWATTLSVAISTLTIFIIICRKYVKMNLRENGKFIIKILICDIVMCVGILVLKYFFSIKLTIIVRFFIQLFIGAILFVTMLFLLRIEEVEMVLKSVRKKRKNKL